MDIPLTYLKKRIQLVDENVLKTAYSNGKTNFFNLLISLM